MKKRTLCLILSALMLLASLAAAGCTQTDAPATAGTDNPVAEVPKTGEKITVILPRHEMDTIGFHEEKTRQFEAETGIEVELINMGWDQVADRLTADLTAGGGSYDVIEFDNAWVEKFVHNDWLEPLDSYVSDEIMSGMVPGLLEKFSSGGHLYGITWNNDTRFYMYNAAKLKEAGIDKAPETWDEVVADAQVLKEKGLANYAYVDCYAQEWAGANELLVAVQSFGGKLIDENGKPVMANDPKTKAAYQFLVDGINNGLIDPASLTSNQEAICNVFCMGDTFLFIQAWPSVYATANNPEASNIVDQIAVADYALHAEGEEPLILTLPEAMAIPKTSQHKEAAWKYIEYMSSKELDKERCLALGSLPIWTELLTDADLLAKFPFWENFSKQIGYAKGLPNVLWYDEFVNILTIESQKILLGQVSVDEGLASIQAQCEAAMKDYE